MSQQLSQTLNLSVAEITPESLLRRISSISAPFGGGGHHQKIDNRAAIVIEVGTRLTRIGLAGEFVPRDIFRSEYVDPLRPSEPAKSIFPLAGSREEPRSEAEQHLLLVKFFKNIVFRKLLTTMVNRRVVVVESLLTPTRERDAVARALFETPSLCPHSVLFAPSHLLAAFPFAAKTCLVVDVGVRETLLFPVADGFLMLYNWETTPLGTAAVEEEVRRLLIKWGQVRTKQGANDEEEESARLRKFAAGEEGEEDLAKLDRLRLAEDVVFRFCFATTMERGMKLQVRETAAQDPQSDDYQPPPGVELPFGDDILVVPGIVRESAAECLFGDGINSDQRSLPQLILDCIRRVPIDLKRHLLSSLLLTGGLARMPGFLDRLRNELRRLCLDGENEFGGAMARLADEARFYRSEHQVNVELYGAWLGGAMFAALDNSVDGRAVTREQWFAQTAEAASTTRTEERGGKREEDLKVKEEEEDFKVKKEAGSSSPSLSTKPKPVSPVPSPPSSTRPIACLIRRTRTVPDWTNRIDDYHHQQL